MKQNALKSREHLKTQPFTIGGEITQLGAQPSRRRVLGCDI